jgi:hypothetical protein
MKTTVLIRARNAAGVYVTGNKLLLVDLEVSGYEYIPRKDDVIELRQICKQEYGMDTKKRSWCCRAEEHVFSSEGWEGQSVCRSCGRKFETKEEHERRNEK